jgi:hypothetical protein
LDTLADKVLTGPKLDEEYHHCLAQWATWFSHQAGKVVESGTYNLCPPMVDALEAVEIACPNFGLLLEFRDVEHHRHGTFCILA